MSNPIRDLPTKEGEWFVILIETVRNRVTDGGSLPSVSEILADIARLCVGYVALFSGEPEMTDFQRAVEALDPQSR